MRALLPAQQGRIQVFQFRYTKDLALQGHQARGSSVTLVWRECSLFAVHHHHHCRVAYTMMCTAATLHTGCTVPGTRNEKELSINEPRQCCALHVAFIPDMRERNK